MSENDFVFGSNAHAFVCVCGNRYLAKKTGTEEERELALTYVDWYKPDSEALLECPCGASLETRHEYLLGQWATA